MVRFTGVPGCWQYTTGLSPVGGEADMWKLHCRSAARSSPLRKGHELTMTGLRRHGKDTTNLEARN